MTSLFIWMPPRKLSLWYVSWCDHSPSSFSAFFLILASFKGFYMFLGVFMILASCERFVAMLSRYTFGFFGLVRVFPEVVLLFLLSFIYFSFSPLFPLGLFQWIVYVLLIFTLYGSKWYINFAQFIAFYL